MKIKTNKSAIISASVALAIGLAGGIGIGRICLIKNNKTAAVEYKNAELKENSQSNNSDNSIVSIGSIVDSVTHTNSGYSAEWQDDSTAFEIEGTYSNAKIQDVHLEKSGRFGYVLTINFLYTNNSDDACNFINDSEVYVRTFQNGIELDHPGYTSEDGVFDTNNSYTNIKQGATLATQLAFIVPDPSEPVEMEIGPWGQSDKIITKQVNFIKE